MNFTHLFASDMAAALNISSSRVLVESVVSGSLIVNFKIIGSPTEPVTPDILADTFKSPGEIIGGLASTAAILAGEIMETAQACNAPVVADIVMTCADVASSMGGGFLDLLATLADRIGLPQSLHYDATSRQVESSQAEIDAFAAEFCASNCNATLRHLWLSCNRGVYMAPKIQLALTPFAFVLDGFCGMIDEETSGPQVEAALLAAILDDPPDEPLIPMWAFPVLGIAPFILWFWQKKQLKDAYFAGEEGADEMVGKRYKLSASGVIRAEFDLDSKKAGKLKKGDVIEVLAAQETKDGQMQVQFCRGWTNTVSSDGKRLLEPTNDEATVTDTRKVTKKENSKNAKGKKGRRVADVEMQDNPVFEEDLSRE